MRESAAVFNIEIDEHVRSLMLNMARWTKFLAILGFIFMGLMLVGAVIVGGYGKAGNSTLDENTQTVLIGEAIGLCIASIAISFYPCYTLLMYSGKIKKAFLADSQELFEKAIRNLKNTFQYMSILMIISLFTSCFSLVAILVVALQKLGS